MRRCRMAFTSREPRCYDARAVSFSRAIRRMVSGNRHTIRRRSAEYDKSPVMYSSIIVISPFAD